MRKYGILMGMFFDVDIFWKLQFLKHFVYLNHAYFSIAWFRADVDLTKKKLWKSAMFHSIKLPFDAKVDEKFLNVI